MLDNYLAGQPQLGTASQGESGSTYYRQPILDETMLILVEREAEIPQYHSMYTMYGKVLKVHFMIICTRHLEVELNFSI